MKQSLQEKIHSSVLALAVCHNVTPVIEENYKDDDEEETILYDNTAASSCKAIKYQASSPDEVSIGIYLLWSCTTLRTYQMMLGIQSNHTRLVELLFGSI